MMLNWNFQRGGGGGLRKNPLHGGAMDIFWNYTQIVQGKQNLRATHACLQGKVGFKFLWALPSVFILVLQLKSWQK